MQIKTFSLLEGAKQATGLTVIIDVFRAFSTACYIYNNGAEQIIPVGNIDIAYKLKVKNPDYILVGERKGIKAKGFDFGNSPTEIEMADFTGKTIVHTTSSGTQGIVNAKNADEIITGSFVNANAIIKYIQSKNPKVVSLVAMGGGGKWIAPEDELCAKYFKYALKGKSNNFEKIRNQLRTSETANNFFNESAYWAPEKDFDLCLDLDRFNFVLKVETNKNNYPFLEKY